MYIKNRNSVTHLHPYGVLLTLMPNARKKVSDSPGIRQAIKDGLLIETQPITSETHEIVGWYDINESME